MRDLTDALGVKVGFLSRVEPVEGAQKVRYVIEFLDGTRGRITGPWSWFDGTRAVFFPYSGGSPLILFYRAGFSGLFQESLRGELWHEIAHAVRHIYVKDEVPIGRVWSLLVDHAERLRVLDMTLTDYLEKVGRSDAATERGGSETLRQRYEREYRREIKDPHGNHVGWEDYRDKPERIKQAAAADAAAPTAGPIA